MEESRHSPANADTRSRFRIERVLFPLIFVIIVLAILADQVPAIHEAREKFLHPEEFQALKACHAEALAAAEQPAYARIVNSGQAHATQDAIYVDNVRVGEMGQAGSEVTYDFNCYVGPDGKVVKSRKQTSPRAGG